MHVEHDGGRVLGLSISSPGKFDSTTIADLLAALSDTANRVIADIAGRSHECAIQTARNTAPGIPLRLHDDIAARLHFAGWEETGTLMALLQVIEDDCNPMIRLRTDGILRGKASPA